MKYFKHQNKYHSKQWIMMCLLLWTLVSTFIFWSYSSLCSLQSNIQIPFHVTKEIASILEEHYPETAPSVSGAKSSVYERIFSEDEIFQENKLFHIMRDYSLQDRCELYFENVDSQNGTIVDPNHNFEFNRFNYLNWDEYLQESSNILNVEGDENFRLSAIQLDDIKQSYNYAKAKILEDEQIMHNFFLHVKIFDKCYIDKNDDFIQVQKDLLGRIHANPKLPKLKSGTKKKHYKNLESKIFPWLTQRSPEYEHLLSSEVSTFQFHSNEFLYNLKENLSGRGIVLTISDSHIDDCVRLIHVLRYLQNTLPIQIVYTTLSNLTKFQLKQASTSYFKGYIPQNITLVNVVPAVNETYLHKFDKFGNKILALLFNSFEEVILLDADTVVTQAPQTFFKLHKYEKSGALFYRDRNTAEYRPDHDITMFLSLMNTNMDTKLFGLPQISEKTLSLPIFSNRISHVMESGLVVINRKLHFSQSLIMATMYFYSPIAERVYGDKEMFWLALSIKGDENFEFNNHPAASIGQITPYEERIKGLDSPPRSFLAEEICSNHPAHINDEDDHTLLWFNSGFKFCNQLEKVDFQEEFERKERFTHLTTFEQFKTFWESELLIQGAIVPPMNTASNINHNNEPLQSWKHMLHYCGGYTWCAYSSIGDGKDPADKGIVIRYSKNEQAHFKKLGEIWMSHYNYLQSEEVL